MTNSQVAVLLTKGEVQQHLGSNVAADEHLQRLIDDADQAVVSRYGPHSIDGPVTEVHGGGTFRLFPHRVVKEIAKMTETDWNVSVVLSDDDYRSWYGGRMLQRLADGSHPRSCWGERVELKFTPVDDDAQRRMAIIRLVQLGLPYSGLQSESVGPYSAQNLDSRSLLKALDIAGGLPSPAGVELSRVVWEYVVGGDCEGDEPPVVAGHTSSDTNVSEYERSDEQAHSGNHSWKITVAQGASDSASVFIGFNVAYADLLTMTQITFSAWVYVPASDLLLSDVELELMCGEVDSEGATTWENTRSETPTAYDSWEYLEATTTISAACQNIRLALRVTDRSASHVLYWDDISFRSE